MSGVKIVRVLRGPQEDGGFDADKGHVYVTAWLCDTEIDGRPVPDVKIRVGSQSEGTNPPLAKYITPGGIVVPNRQGVREYKGKKEVYADSKGTKEANGDGFRGGGGSGGGPARATGGHAAPRSGGGYSDTPYTFDELVALKKACFDAALDVLGAHDLADKLDAAQAYSATLFIQATRSGVRLGGSEVREPAPAAGDAGASGHEEDRDEVLRRIKAAITSAGLADDVAAAGLSRGRVLDLWQVCAGNKTEFLLRLRESLPRHATTTTAPARSSTAYLNEPPEPSEISDEALPF